jgi:hypothetical protein
LFLALTTLAAAATPAVSDPITFSGSSGGLAASVTFNVVAESNTLIVTLTNTSSGDVLVPTDVLTALFFTLNDTTLTRDSAVLAPGSTVFFDPQGQPAGGVVGGEWAYRTSPALPYSANHMISSSGLGLVGQFDRFPGDDLEFPVAPDGLQYGLLSAGDNPLTGNAPVTGDNALIRNAVVFTLGGLDCDSVAACGIGEVTFQYGTGLTEGSFSGQSNGTVPEPGTVVLLGLGLSGLAAARRRGARR